MNYKAIIRQHAWLTDAKGRTWIILALRYAWDFNEQKWEDDAYLVTLLEVNKEEPVERPYLEIVECFKKGLMREA